MSTQKQRIASIDVARGLVMLLMTVDHVRETFFLHHQVSDPMDVAATDPALFFTRLTAHFCAPMFVFLTGLSAWLYAHPPAGPRDAAPFLVKRGLLLIGLEIVAVNFAWTGTFMPATLYLQVIWAIGLAMLALALLLKMRVPLAALGALGLAIVAGHNALHPSFEPGGLAAAAWTVLEQRGFLLDAPVRVKISYPVLAWIGVILLGYAAGPLYARATPPDLRRRVLAGLGIGCLALLAVLRAVNGYGEPVPWLAYGDALRTAMSFLNFTKYPPSLDFVLLTLGVGLLVLAWVERPMRWTAYAAVFGGAPLFYYLLHLYALLALQRLAAIATGVPRADVSDVWQVWAIAIPLCFALYWPTRWFARYKRSSGKAWVKYF